MGGREVGGLANQLAAHMNFSTVEVDRVKRFWNAPNMAETAGLKITDMIKAIEAGSLKALWVLGTNPSVSLPQAGDARDAFRKLELFVVSENVASNDTVNSGAHVVLPSTGWGEKDGTVTNSERRISRQRPFLDAPGEAREDWWMVCQVARKLGFHGFDYQNVAEVFAEHAALSSFENDGARDFDLGGLADIDLPAYDALPPTQWPAPASGEREPRLFAKGGFFTPSRRANFVVVAPPQLAEQVSASFPLLMNTGRVRDQWHTMTRTGLSPRLGSHITEPFVSVHPSDATRFGLTDGGLAQLTNHHGKATFRVVVTTNQERGAVFVPMHWNDEMASAARVGSLVHAIVDPISGQPDSKATPVAIAAVQATFAGFVLSRRRVALPRDSYWAWGAIPGGYAARVDTQGDGGDLLAALQASHGANLDVLRYADSTRGVTRAALLDGDKLVGAMFLGPVDGAPKWGLLGDAWAAETIDKATRRIMLSGKHADGAVDEGPNVCACFGVPEGRIIAAIAAGATSHEAIGAKLKAGTNCGSCIPELKRLVVESAAAQGRPRQGVS